MCARNIFHLLLPSALIYIITLGIQSPRYHESGLLLHVHVGTASNYKTSLRYKVMQSHGCNYKLKYGGLIGFADCKIV